MFTKIGPILAGDGLLTLAFYILARPATHANPVVRSQLVLALARAAGPGGMICADAAELGAFYIALEGLALNENRRPPLSRMSADCRLENQERCVRA